MLSTEPNWLLQDILWSEEAMAFIEAELEYKANDIKLRLSAPYPLPFLYEPEKEHSQPKIGLE